jgi:hypothetical protein
MSGKRGWLSGCAIRAVDHSWAFGSYIGANRNSESQCAVREQDHQNRWRVIAPG